MLDGNGRTDGRTEAIALPPVRAFWSSFNVEKISKL